MSKLLFSAQPADVSMTASRNGILISEFTGTIGDPQLVKEGDVLQFKCTGLLGNLPDAKIMWMRTSLSFTSDEFIDMNPGVTANDGNETVGAITELPDQCSRRQTNTLTYVIQNTDKGRLTLAFKCYIQATPPQSATGGQGGIKIIVNSTTAFYMKVGKCPNLFRIPWTDNIYKYRMTYVYVIPRPGSTNIICPYLSALSKKECKYQESIQTYATATPDTEYQFFEAESDKTQENVTNRSSKRSSLSQQLVQNLIDR